MQQYFIHDFTVLYSENGIQFMENIALDQGWRTYGTHQSLLS
jgi:hypothetical protein